MSRKKRRLNSETKVLHQNIEKIQEEEVVAEQELSDSPEQPEPSDSLEEQESEKDAPLEQLGVISSDTRITGDIITDGHLMIGGVVEGNVYAKGDIKVTGNIKGRICCQNLDSYGMIQTDEIEAKGKVILGEGMRITGNVICSDAVISGIIDGNLCISGNLTLSKSAVITGDIKTAAISTELGAIINGNVTMG